MTDCTLCAERGVEHPEHPTRRTVHHGGKGGVHLDGDACPHCCDMQRRVDGDGPLGPYVIVEATTVHVRGCAATRLGKRFGPCDCGGHAMWERNRERLLPIVFGEDR